MKRFLLALLWALPVLASAQENMTGAVIDSVSREALPYATVYVNGTTKGTITDTSGLFELKNVNYPVDLVVSFVGYRTQVFHLTDNPGYLLVELKTNNNLPEVVITDYNERAPIMRYFKRMLLGDDYWASNATIRDEDVLMFEIEGSKLRAWATEPVIIDLPLLGYVLYLDLVSFEAEHVDGKDRCDMLGYFYYKLNNPNSKSKIRKIIKNRQKAFYNSSQHFLKALYANRLEENGFVVSEVAKGDITVWDLKRNIVSVGDNRKQIRGLKDKRLIIEYYCEKDESPINLSVIIKPDYHNYISEVLFLSDSCTFTQDGIVSDNSILFMGEIAEKRVAASLPAE